MTNKDFYLAPWWVRKHSHRLRVKIASWGLIGALIGLSMLLAWVAIGCSTVRPCNSYVEGVDSGVYWDACFSSDDIIACDDYEEGDIGSFWDACAQFQAEDDEEYGQIINSMTWER